MRFWAGAPSLGRTKLHFFTGNLNGVGYRKILQKALPEMKKIFGDQKWTLQHDGASAHKDKKTMTGWKKMFRILLDLVHKESGLPTRQI